MNFNFGEVLSRAGQITWRHKNLWIAGIAVSLMGLIPALISFTVTPSFGSLTTPAEVNRELPRMLLANGLVILLSLLSIPVYVIGMGVPSLGTVQLEKGRERLNLGELLKDTLSYFWRILGIVLLLWGGTFLILMALMACIILAGALTLGIGALCTLPLMIVLIPLMIAAYAVMEQGVAAVLVDNLGVSRALQRGWDLFKKNIGVMLIMSIIIYLLAMVVSMIISAPMMIPMFGFMLNLGSQPDAQAMEGLFRNMTIWTLAFSPVYALLQGILLTFMQAAWMLTYVRLTPPQTNTPVILEAIASNL